MSRKLKCPACGSEISLEQLEQTADLEALRVMEAVYGDDWPLIRGYLNCFRPASGKALVAERRLRLGLEVQDMWRSGRFEFNRRQYEVGREEFKEALRITCNQVSPPLSNHNYLKKVLVKAAEQTSKRRERELRDNEEQLRSGLRRTGETPALPDDPEWRAKLAELGKAVRRAKTPEAKAEASRRYAEHMKEAGA